MIAIEERKGLMNVSRAVQIVESTDEFLVTYNDIPVWIQRVNEDNETARVYSAQDPEKEMDIPVEHLEEK
jgi:small acid-soluble spore protein H (minor)